MTDPVQRAEIDPGNPKVPPAQTPTAGGETRDREIPTMSPNVDDGCFWWTRTRISREITRDALQTRSVPRRNTENRGGSKLSADLLRHNYRQHASDSLGCSSRKLFQFSLKGEGFNKQYRWCVATKKVIRACRVTGTVPGGESVRV